MYLINPVKPPFVDTSLVETSPGIRNTLGTNICVENHCSTPGLLASSKLRALLFLITVSLHILGRLCIQLIVIYLHGAWAKESYPLDLI